MVSSPSETKRELSSNLKSYLTPTEVATLLMVSSHTVRKWVKKGWLQAEQTPGGHRRFLRECVEDFARERGLTLNCRRGERMRVLVVEPHAERQTEAVDALSGAHDDIIAVGVSSAFEAGLKVTSFGPEVLLMSLTTPGLDAVAVCKALHQQPACRGIQVIVVADESDSSVVRAAIEAGAEYGVTRPINWLYVFELMGIDPYSGETRQ